MPIINTILFVPSEVWGIEHAEEMLHTGASVEAVKAFLQQRFHAWFESKLVGAS